MSIDGTQTAVRIDPANAKRFRADEGRIELRLPEARTWAGPAILVLGLVSVVVGGAAADLTDSDARLALAASEAFGPLGQVYGHWRPDVWPLPAAVARLAHLLLVERGRPDAGTVLWPSAIAGLAAGWILARRFLERGRTSLALLVGLGWFGSTALLNHSGSAGVDFFSGLAVIAALDRLLARRSDWIAGLWASAAFLAGGWPPLLILALAILVLGRRDADFSIKLIIPPVLTAVAWLAWTVQAASAEAAAAALTWPLTQRLSWEAPRSIGGLLAALVRPISQKPAWAVPLGVLALGLPLAPFALLLFSRPLRQRLQEQEGEGRPSLVLDWARISAAALIGGMVVPGLATAAALPALAGLIVAAAAGLEAAWSETLSPSARRAFFGLVVAFAAGWMFLALYGTYILTIVYTYYRPIGVVFGLASLGVAALAWRAVETGSARRGVLAAALLVACLKWAHWGFYVPEWNYRYGQGPWGRAIGQWMLPHWPLHTLHQWPEDLCWAIGRPVRLLPSPQHLAFPETEESRHVLLLESEFENWPPSAPKLIKVATFEPPHPAGSRRILARTEGVLTTPSGRLVSRVPSAE